MMSMSLQSQTRVLDSLDVTTVMRPPGVILGTKPCSSVREARAYNFAGICTALYIISA